MNFLITLIFIVSTLGISLYGLYRSNSHIQRMHWGKTIFLEFLLICMCVLNWPVTILGPQDIGDTIFAYASALIFAESLFNWKRYTVLR